LDAKSTWSNIAAGRVGIGPIPAVESELPSGSTGGQAPELPDGYCTSVPREARYLRWVIEQALAISRPTEVAPTRVGLVLGTTLHGIRAGGRFLRGGDTVELASFLAGATASLAIQGLGVEGPAITTCSACSSSLGAVALGVTLLESGQVDAVIAGGYDAIGEYVWAGFNSLRLVASGPVRPFARDRQGMKVSEGFGVMILERRRDAERRGAKVCAVIEGWGESADAHHLTQPHPEGEGAAATMKDALARAGCRARDVAFVAAHATATPDNDASEYLALKAVFGSDLSGTPVIGFKSYLGHTLGGAGAVELILALQALEAGTVPPCANVSAADVEFEGMLVAPPKGLPCRSNRAMTNSLGFGGANTSVVLSREVAARIARAHASPAPRAWITGVGVILPGISGFGDFLERLFCARLALRRNHHARDR
jgi:3-oxoacyl-[acyl-carrier-protein] synthase II